MVQKLCGNERKHCEINYAEYAAYVCPPSNAVREEMSLLPTVTQGHLVLYVQQVLLLLLFIRIICGAKVMLRLTC